MQSRKRATGDKPSCMAGAGQHVTLSTTCCDTVAWQGERNRTRPADQRASAGYMSASLLAGRPAVDVGPLGRFPVRLQLLMPALGVAPRCCCCCCLKLTSKRVWPSQTTPLLTLAAVYEKPSAWPDLRPKRPWRLGPTLLAPPASRVWH